MKIGATEFFEDGTAVTNCQICEARSDHIKPTDYLVGWGVLGLVTAGASVKEQQTVRLSICPDCLEAILEDCPALVGGDVATVTPEDLEEIVEALKNENNKPKLLVVKGDLVENRKGRRLH
jgi:hypothetical protein